MCSDLRNIYQGHLEVGKFMVNQKGIQRSPSELLKRGYSDEELSHIYELGRLFLENGQIKRAESIFTGVSEVAPDFPAAWLGLAYIQIINASYESACRYARIVLQLDPDNVAAMLYLVPCLLSLGDLNSAGTFLGEVGERIENGSVSDPDFVRFYKMQLVRYQGMI